MCNERKQMSECPFPETFQADVDNRCSTRLESGYKVMACYPEGREDHRPLRLFSHTPEGLREAIEYAAQVATDPCERSDLDNRYQVDDWIFDPVVYEFCTQLKEICRLTSTEEDEEDLAASSRECAANGGVKRIPDSAMSPTTAMEGSVES